MAETVIGTLEDAEDYRAFEAAVIADYDAQSAVERELVLRLTSLLWRLRRATTIENGLFETQAEYLCGYRRARQQCPDSRDIIHAMFERIDLERHNTYADSQNTTNKIESLGIAGTKSDRGAIEFARCFLRLANLPNFALDRLSRYEASLWRQADQILFALETLDRRKLHERRHRFAVDD